MAELKAAKPVERDELTFIKEAVAWLQKQNQEAQARVVKYLNARYNLDSWDSR